MYNYKGFKMITPQEVKEILDKYNERIEDIEGIQANNQNKFKILNLRISKLQDQFMKLENAFVKFISQITKDVVELENKIKRF